MHANHTRLIDFCRAGISVSLIALVSACGGGGSGSATASNGTSSAQSASGTVVFGTDGTATRLEAIPVTLAPAYHLAPVLPPPPSSIDADGSSRSARMAPAASFIPAALQNAPTRASSPATLSASPPSYGVVSAGASGSPVVTYSPAQIRAAYGLPPVPSSLTGLTPLQAAQFGAGSTIYVVDSFHDPYAFSELSAFSELFGLPQCNKKTLAAAAPLPLPATTPNTCDFYQVSSTTSGGMSDTAPAYDVNWSTEIAMDTQWAHAIAPLARIVLIESPAASLAAITGAIQLVNRMGPGVVSMSFGGAEGSYVNSLDSYFQTSGMSYFASTGDSGAGVSWPAVSPYVVAVGGTSLTYNGSGTRSETAWALTGGGSSAYEPAPAYQSSAVPGLGTPGHRTVADVAFNADPTHGQFIAVIPNPLTCTFCQVSWLTAGGTSLSTPQWAGIAAVINALRVQAGKPAVGDPHSVLYAQATASATAYASDFDDVTQGSDGSCTTCAAKKGYDALTGLGTPNGLALINALVGAAVASPPPVVSGATINGNYYQSLSFTASVSAANAYTLSLSGAPAGMTISPNAVVSWPVPVPGSYSVTVVAKDSKTGVSGQGVYKIVIAPPPPPLVSSGSIGGSAGKALSFSVGVGDVNPCTLTLSGAPAGMTISSAGLISWANPTIGAYRVTVTARDGKTGLTGQGVYTVAISVPLAPSVGSGSLSAKPGTPLSFSVSVIDSNPYTLALNGAPAGMTISNGGTVNWSNPVAGQYTVTVLAKDGKTGLSGEGMYSVMIGTATGPAVTASTMTGVAGKPLTGTIAITDAGSSLVGVGFFGGPLGLSFTPQGGGFNNFSVSWPSPVTGSYTIQVSATDSAGMQAQVTIPLVITSK